jgi:hypothetical protein
MESLYINETQSTPKVILDKTNQQFEISGNSLPEDVMGFYTPILNWMEKYIENPNPQTIFVFKLYYFNSASSKVILDILTAIEQLIKDGHDAKIDWYYLEVDEDMLSTGNEYAELLKIPFNFIPYT